MALPTIPVPHFPIKKSQYVKQAMTLRPFLVGEEAILLQVKDSEEPSEVMGAVKQVIEQCVVEPKNFSVSTVPIFILELLFARLTQISKGEITELQYRCNNQVDDKVCGNVIDVPLDIRKTDIYTPEGHTNLFDVGGGIGIELNYPSLAMVESLTNQEDWLEMIVASIQSIYSGEDVWLATDHTKEELMKFAKNISSKTKEEIQDKFHGRMPVLKSTIHTHCTKCQHKETIDLIGLQDHFG